MQVLKSEKNSQDKRTDLLLLRFLSAYGYHTPANNRFNLNRAQKRENMNKVSEYLEAHQQQKRDVMELVEEFSDKIAEMHGKCIDIGCGPGTTTRSIFLPCLPADATVVGADLSRRMIDFAKTNHEDERRLSFIILDAETDKLPAQQMNAYDNLVSFYCLQWCGEFENACKNIFDLLRPGGNALLLFVASHPIFNSFLAMHENPQYKPYMEDVSTYVPLLHKNKSPRALLKRILQDTGFEVVHCSVREKTFTFSEDFLNKFTTPIDPFMDRMPTEVMKNYRKDLLNDLVKRCISFSNFNNGSITDELKVLVTYKIAFVYIIKPKS